MCMYLSIILLITDYECNGSKIICKASNESDLQVWNHPANQIGVQIVFIQQNNQRIVLYIWRVRIKLTSWTWLWHCHRLPLMPYPSTLIPPSTGHEAFTEHAEVQPNSKLGVMLPAPGQWLGGCCIPQLHGHVIGAWSKQMLSMWGPQDTSHSIAAWRTHKKLVSGRPLIWWGPRIQLWKRWLLSTQEYNHAHEHKWSYDKMGKHSHG
jgi:hypothetical protein